MLSRFILLIFVLPFLAIWAHDLMPVYKSYMAEEDIKIESIHISTVKEIWAYYHPRSLNEFIRAIPEQYQDYVRGFLRMKAFLAALIFAATGFVIIILHKTNHKRRQTKQNSSVRNKEHIQRMLARKNHSDKFKG